jgi:hypothetical protein
MSINIQILCKVGRVPHNPQFTGILIHFYSAFNALRFIYYSHTPFDVSPENADSV